MTREIAYGVRLLKRGAECGRLQWPGSAPQITVDSGAEIKSSFAGAFLAEDAGDLLNAELQPCISIDGTEYPLGIFRVATLRTVRDGVTTLSVEAYDRAWLLKSRKTEGLLHMATGSGYMAQIESLLTAAGIAMAVKTASSATLPADKEFESGTDYLSIVNQLLSEMGYSDIWFDASGWAHLAPYAAPSAARITHQYGAGDVTLLPMADKYSEETDIFDAPNVFTAICSNADNAGVLTATAENNVPTSAKSIFRRGMRICQVTKVDQTANQVALQTSADRLRDESLFSTRTVTFYTPPEAGHGVGDILGINIPALAGVYEETGWTLSLESGQWMTHKARRTVIT